MFVSELKIFCLIGINVLLLITFSNWLPCSSGIPSILGTTLFNIYINNLLACVHHSDILLYADDVKMFKRIRCSLHCVQFQEDIFSISNWCALWQLKLNVSKCISLQFGLVDRSSCDFYKYSLPLQI